MAATHRILFPLFSLLVLAGGPVRAQECDCSAQLSAVIQYFERNSPAFQNLKTDRPAFSYYTKAVKKLKRTAGKEKDSDRCIVHLDHYVYLLRDHHSGIGFNLKRIDLGTDEAIRAFKATPGYKAFRVLPIDTARIIAELTTKPVNDVEGLYSDGRNTFFGIIEVKGSPGHYQGIVLKPNKLLDVGHILLDITRKKENYDVVYNVGLLGFNFQRIFKNLPIENGQIANFGFSKTGQRPVQENYEFRSLDSTTNYLKLKSFNGRLINELDSFYRTIDAAIRSRPLLVIDLRDNGGGSERAYLELLRYAYTRPLNIDPAEIWVSPENIQRYEETGAADNAELIKRMKAAKPFSFIPLSEDSMVTWTLDSVTTFPRKIALLFNRGTASAAEGMIHYYIQSDKVITLGENSGGYIGYGNVMTAATPCGKFTIQNTTTRYFEKSKYEFTGIAPQVTLPTGADWIEEALKILKQQ